MNLPSCIDRNELSSLLPHKGKMFLLSRITDYDIANRTLTAEYDITEDCIFYDPELDGVPAWASFEFMAQCISALSGLAGRERGKPPKPGFILSISAMEVQVPVLKAGTTAAIKIMEDMRMDMVFTFSCTVFVGGEQAVSAKLTVMDVDDVSLFSGEKHGS
ncbi:MAG: 3-hydroxylacyl-ACP dehydratase [Treponema sp.]|jgi:predicted hotdog family 3-hydroxylacyl-ACP dehydratase|nr:3-hydroxylacyl-ACP dehydratase [Treponema sp.]